MLWAGIEAVLILVCALIVGSQPRSSEATGKYFIVQVLSGIVVLISVLRIPTRHIALYFAVALKIGLFPFH